MIVSPTAFPTSTTPAPTLASAVSALLLQPRQTGVYGGLEYDCITAAAVLQCESIIASCAAGLATATDYLAAGKSCICNYGIPYLNCVSNAMTGSCTSILGIADWGAYEMSFFSSSCGSIPPTAMAQMKPPASVSLHLETVHVVTATGALQNQNYNGQPDYKGTGALLQGPCSTADFTLVDAGSTVYFAGFLGCVGNRPECCPWPVATATAATAGLAPASTGVNVQDNRPYNFPVPTASAMAQLSSCADDYYSISGQCCPVGFWPFTSAVGGLTPCWSSVRSVHPPTLTVEKNPSTPTNKPTSAVVNIIWAMSYPVGESGGGLSTAAKAGIGAGAGVAAILIGGLAICLWRSRRKNRKLLKDGQGQGQGQAGTPGPNQPQAMAMQQPAQPNAQYQYAMPKQNEYQYPSGAAFPMAPPLPPLSSYSTTVPPSTMAPSTSPSTLVPQHTGTSGGGVSELSSLSGQGGLVQHAQPAAGGYFAGAAVPYGGGGNSGTTSPVQQPGGYPAPIAEADEGGGQFQFQGQGRGQGQYQQYYYYAAAPTQQMGSGAYPPNVSEMSAHREVDPPQEVMGSEVPGRAGVAYERR